MKIKLKCALILLYLTCHASAVLAWPHEGFTEPFKLIEVAAAENGILQRIAVVAGESVKVGQILAVLDNRVLQASLRIAQARKAARGTLQAAQARQTLHQQQLNRLLPLVSQGLVQQIELDQSSADVAVAKADVQAAKDQQYIHALSVKQIEAQLQRRNLRSPIDGVVTEVHKQVAEWVGGNEPVVITVAQVHPLQVRLHLPTADALSLDTQQPLLVQCADDRQHANHEAMIDFVSPLTDAGSDTVEVTLNLNKATPGLRSGLKCQVYRDAPKPESK